MKDKTHTSKVNLYLGIAGGLLVGLFLGWLFLGGPPAQEGKEAGAGTPTEEVYTCAMHPQVRQIGPGLCPICGMELSPVSEAGNDPFQLTMTREAVQLGNIRTLPVSMSSPEKVVRMQGKVEVDERRISLISSRIPGRIEKLYVDFTGMEVYKGQKLAAIYSPELVTAQRELLEALDMKEASPSLYKAARNKLKLWDISEAQIDEIEAKGEVIRVIDVFAPHGGVVQERHATLGQYVKEGTPLFEVADLSRVWVVFNAYEADLPWLRRGDEVEYRVNGTTGDARKGKIAIIDPVLDPTTRTIPVRVEVANGGLGLKPGMFVEGLVEARAAFEGERLIVPKSAVLWTGPRSVVYVAEPDSDSPTFELREIELGTDMGNHYVVNEGLQAGEEVVAQGAFKVDAAAQLAGKYSMMNRPGQTAGEVQAPEAFRKAFTTFVRDYLDLKNALVASDAARAAQLAGKALQSLNAVKADLLEGETGRQYTARAGVMDKQLRALAGTKDLEEQRKAFHPLSDAVLDGVERYGLEGLTLYKDYCPMANEDRGAYWLSEFKEIRNPYFGDKMMKCGEIKKVLGSPSEN